jgi:hypothetical protein
LTAVLDGGATAAAPDVERSHEARAVNAPNALNLALATMLAKAALMLVRAIFPMLRRTPPELNTAALPTNA